MERGPEVPVRTRTWPVAWAELGGGLVLLLAHVAALGAMLELPARVVLAAVLVYLAMAGLVAWHWLAPRRPLGAANRVTLWRAVLVALLAGMLASPPALAEHAMLVAGGTLCALLLDGVDGWVARRFGCASAFGARFDMEVDAFLILVLCVQLVLLGKAGPWVLAIGAMRYVFVAAMRVWPWLARPLPERRRRKAVCVWQGASLLACLAPAVGPALAAPVLGLALALLTLSFALDVHWLRLQRARERLCWNHRLCSDEETPP